MVAVVLLSGCGYQLKGQFRFADGLSPMVWQADVDAEELYVALRQTFALYGLVLADKPADVLVHVHAVNTSEVQLSDATVLGMDVSWSLVNAYGETLIRYRQTRVETRLSQSPEVDEDDARSERFDYLRNRIALRILDQLEALDENDLARRPAADTTEPE